MSLQRGGYGMTARGLVLSATAFTSSITLLLPNSSASRTVGCSVVGIALTWLSLSAAFLGWADLVWHDWRGRLIMPRLGKHIRHRVCVALYHFIAAMWLIRAMAMLGGIDNDPIERVVLAAGYVITGAWVGVLAVQMAFDER